MKHSNNLSDSLGRVCRVPQTDLSHTDIEQAAKQGCISPKERHYLLTMLYVRELVTARLNWWAALMKRRIIKRTRP